MSSISKNGLSDGYKILYDIVPLLLFSTDNLKEIVPKKNIKFCLFNFCLLFFNQRKFNSKKIDFLFYFRKHPLKSNLFISYMIKRLASLNLNIATLPTEADLPRLRVGDVYRDTQDGVQATSQMLRIKVPVFLSGVQGTGSVGSVGPVGGTITLGLTGVSSTGAVGTVTP